LLNSSPDYGKKKKKKKKKKILIEPIWAAVAAAPVCNGI
jgi:hypothetical protein